MRKYPINVNSNEGKIDWLENQLAIYKNALLKLLPKEIKGIVKISEAVEAVREGFREWGEDSQINAPRRRVHIPTGVRVSVHQGGVPSLGATGLMTHCEWVKPMSDRQEYPRLNHPVIILYDTLEGKLKGIIIGEITCSELPNNVAVTGLRTAASSAVGTDLLARKDADGGISLLGEVGGDCRVVLHLQCPTIQKQGAVIQDVARPRKLQCSGKRQCVVQAQGTSVSDQFQGPSGRHLKGSVHAQTNIIGEVKLGRPSKRKPFDARVVVHGQLARGQHFRNRHTLQLGHAAQIQDAGRIAQTEVVRINKRPASGKGQLI